MAAHSDELSVATEITAATTETTLLDSRKTERVCGPKKTSPVWHFIHRLVNGPVTNHKGKETEYVCTLCVKSKIPWASCLISLSNHNPANGLSHLKCRHLAAFSQYMDEQLVPTSADNQAVKKTPAATGGILSMLSKGNSTLLDKVHVHLASVMVSHGLPLSFSQSPDVTALLQAATELKALILLLSFWYSLSNFILTVLYMLLVGNH